MPPFPERESSILAKLKKKRKDKTGSVDKEEKPEPVEKPTANGQVPVTNEVQTKHYHKLNEVLSGSEYELSAPSG